MSDIDISDNGEGVGHEMSEERSVDSQSASPALRRFANAKNPIRDYEAERASVLRANRLLDALSDNEDFQNIIASKMKPQKRKPLETPKKGGARHVVRPTEKRKHVTFEVSDEDEVVIINKAPRKENNSPKSVAKTAVISERDLDDNYRVESSKARGRDRMRAVETPPLSPVLADTQPVQQNAQVFELSDGEEAMDIDAPAEQEVEQEANDYEVAGLENIAQDNGRAARIHCCHVALTLAQTTITPNEFGTRILTKYGRLLKIIVVVQENGEVGEHIHCHAYLQFKKKPSILFKEMFDTLAIPNPKTGRNDRPVNIATVRSHDRYKVYLGKEQENEGISPLFAKYGDGTDFDFRLWVGTASKAGGGFGAEMAQYVMEQDGKITRMEMYKKFPQMTVERHWKYIENMAKTYLSFSIFPNKPWVGRPLVANPVENRLNACLDACIPELKKGGGLALKKNCIVILGPPNMRKSGNVKDLMKYVSGAAYVNCDNKSFPLALQSNDNPDIFIIESFVPSALGMDAGQMEKFIDMDVGQVFNIKGSTWSPRRRVLIIINTNIPLKDWWKKGVMGADGQVNDTGLSEALKARINLFKFDTPMTSFENPEGDLKGMDEKDIVRPTDDD